MSGYDRSDDYAGPPPGRVTLYVVAAVLIALVGILLAGCSAPQVAMLAGNPHGALDLMRGTGSVSRLPSGETTFRYVIPVNAFDGVIPAERHEEQRRAMLAGWIGREDVCPSSYEVTSRTIAADHVIYEGRCRSELRT